MKHFTCLEHTQDKGAALIIVLAFIVLLTALVLAYFNRATSDRQLAAGAFGDEAADLLARSAMSVVVGDFKQEIVEGSNPIPTNTTPATYYSPSPNANVVPQRDIAASAEIPNLIRISVRSDSLVPPAVGSRASAVNSTNNPSLNGRLISTSRWNKHCLVPMGDPGTANTDPSPIPSFSPPDWVYVTAQGPTPAPSPAAVIGRYAYAVYDEGGLLDMNVAGFPNPTPSPSSLVGRKGIVTFADMRALPYNSAAIPGATPSSAVSFTALGQIVGWRNNATLQAMPTPWPSWQVSQTNSNNFSNLYLSTSLDFTTPSTATYNTASKSTDQVFLSRAELLNFNKFQISSSSAFDSNTLACIGTFSRDRNVPTCWLPQVKSSAGQSTVYPLSDRFLILNLASVVPNPSLPAYATLKLKFGLQWISSANRWRYVTPTGVGNPAPPAQDISPPGLGADFFQLLRYARSTSTYTPSLGETLAIGAAIIDQYDPDTTTTQIEYADQTGATLIAYGMEASDRNRPSGGTTPAPTPPTGGYPMWNQALRNVGEFGYAYSASSPNTDKTLDFFTSTSSNYDPRILDLFTFNTASPRAGQVNLNTRNETVLAAIIRGAWKTTTTDASNNIIGGTGVASTNAASVAGAIVAETRNNPALGRQDIARICAANGVGSAIGSSMPEAREAIARALGEVCTTRTWGLLIDVIAQSGRCKPNTTNLTDFAVDGEKRYWLHVAIDRFYGDIIDQQLEEVLE